jgi:FKBP-type peptidyl-prolyl cis-trans isomerase (trigger factor)
MRLGREALNEAGIDTLGPVEAEAIECERDKPIRFQVRFHPMPDIRLPEISSLKIDTGDTDPRGQISVRLLELVPFEVPGELVRDELALDGIHGEEPGSAEWEAAGDRIRLMLILKRIAKQEGIEVDEADLKCRIDEKTKEFGMTVKALEAELAKGGGMQRLSDMLLAESTLDYLLERNQNGVS